MGKVAGGTSGRRTGVARGAWLAYMGTAVAAPAFGQQTAAQLDDLTRTMTQYSQPKANAQVPAAATSKAKASASAPEKHPRRSAAPPSHEKTVLLVRKPAAAPAKPALPIREAAMPSRAPAATIRATPNPSVPKVATSTLSQPQSKPSASPARTLVVATPAAPAVASTVAAVSKANATATPIVGRQNGDAPFWKRPWSWVAGAAVFVLLLVEVVGWRRHHSRKRDAKVLASIVPTVRPGDREADYHPRPSQPPDHPRPFGAG